MTTTPRPLLSVGRRGFSMVEMVVSLAIVSILMVGMTSAIVLASRALPNNDGPAAATVESARALHQLRDDLRAATELLNRTATSVTLHLPDRDGDGRAEVISYAWAGNPGDPLTRAANGGAAVTVLPGLDSFALAYTTTDHDTAFPGPSESTSSEQLLSSYEVTSPGSHKLGDDDWLGAQIAPTLPSGTASWRITRALFSGAKQGGSGSTITFELRDWGADEPGSTILESVEMEESDMTDSFVWYEATFTGDVTFSASQTASLVLANYGGGDAGKWQNDENGPTPRNLYNTTDQGDSWEPDDGDNDNHILHYVYGTYDSPSDDWTYTRPRITAVGLTLVNTNAPAATHQLNIALPNAPETAALLWEADFDADPTTLDQNGDGVQDWMSDGAFDTNDLDGGRWEATDTLESWPEGIALDLPFTLDVWGEDTVDNGDGGGARLRFDRDGPLQAYVTVQFDLTSAGQVVNVHSKDAAGVQVDWVTQTQPSGQSVHVALAVDPARDTVGIRIDGQVVGSFGYERLSNAGNQDVLRSFVDGTNSGVFLDHLRLTTGGSAAITPGAYTTGSASGSGAGSSESGESDGSSSLIDEGVGTESAKSSGSESGTSTKWWEKFFQR